jgi:proline iminopeptidase
MKKISRAIVFAGISAAVIFSAKNKLKVWGATPAEHADHYPGDEFVDGAGDASTFATTIEAPPSAVWPWLTQMGTDRGGFYSWDHLDNGGSPSADRVHPEWQDLREGGRINTVPWRSWFDVPVLEPEQLLVLRASIALPSGKSFDPSGPRPHVYMDGVWSFHLHKEGKNKTRLVVRSLGISVPNSFGRISDPTLFVPAHWLMQTRQLTELKRLVESA